MMKIRSEETENPLDKDFFKTNLGPLENVSSTSLFLKLIISFNRVQFGGIAWIFFERNVELQ